MFGAERAHRAVVRDPAERDDGAQLRHLGDGRRQKIAAGLDFCGVGLFSGGTQRTALVIRQSISSSPSSGCAP